MPELGDIIPQNAIAVGICMLLLGGGGLLALLIVAVRTYKNPPKLSELEANVHARSWTWYDASIIVFALLMTWLLAMLILSAMVKLGYEFSGEVTPGAVFLSAFVFHIPAVLVITAVTVRRRMSLRDAFGIETSQLIAMLTKGIILCIAVLPVIWAVTLVYDLILTALGIPLEMQTVVSLFLSDQYGLPLRLAIVLLAVVFVPFSEELLFRGVLFPAIAKRAGVITGSIIVSIMFAALHRNIPSLAPLFVLSMILCLASARSGSVAVPIAMHATFNLVHIALMTIMTL